MLVVGWSFTNACNLRCKHCYNNSGSKRSSELSLKDSERIADKLNEYGVSAINFGGGECPLRGDFLNLCKYLKYSLGMKLSLTTNGTTFPLIKNDINLFHDVGVSIDFPDRKRHDNFRGVKGTFDKAINTIKNINESGIKTEAVTCLTKLNSDIKTIKDLHTLVIVLDADSWRINRYRPVGRNEYIPQLTLTKNKLRIAYSFISNLCNSHPISDPIMRSFSGGDSYLSGCACGSSSFRIQPDGEVTPCIFLKKSGGNIKNKSVEDIFNSPIFRSINKREPAGKCKKCNSYEHCKGGCAGASFLKYGHFNGPDPLCWMNGNSKKPIVEMKRPKEWNVHELYLCTIYVPIKKV